MGERDTDDHGPPGCNGVPVTQTRYVRMVPAAMANLIPITEYGSWPVHYCFDPAKGVALKDMGWTVHGLSACQGDCDSDNDCKDELKCMHDAKPPGCTGTPVYTMDYCYDPLAAKNAAKAPLFKSLTFEDVVDPEGTTPWKVTMSGRDLGILALFA